jgi:hypothetical protein
MMCVGTTYSSTNAGKNLVIFIIHFFRALRQNAENKNVREWITEGSRVSCTQERKLHICCRDNNRSLQQILLHADQRIKEAKWWNYMYNEHG